MPPKVALPPTRVQRTADALIAAPPLTEVRPLAHAIRAIKRVYYAALGAARRRALRARLDAHYAALVELTRSPDKRTAGAALRALPPSLRPRVKAPRRRPRS